MITEIAIDTIEPEEICSELKQIILMLKHPELEEELATELMDGSWKVGNAVIDFK